MSDDITKYKENAETRKQVAKTVWTAINMLLSTAYNHGVDHADNGGEFTLVEAVRPVVDDIVKSLSAPNAGYEGGYRDGWADCEEDSE